MTEEGIRPRGSVIQAKCGELLPLLFPRLGSGTDAGQKVGWVEFFNCNLCSGGFLSVFARNQAQLRSLSISNSFTVTDDPSQLMSYVCEFQGLNELSISLRGGERLLSLIDLGELQALQTLNLFHCYIVDIDVLQDLSSLLVLNFHCIHLPRDEGGTANIDKLSFVHFTTWADLPASQTIKLFKL